jgi:hypothetical protein
MWKNEIDARILSLDKCHLWVDENRDVLSMSLGNARMRLRKIDVHSHSGIWNPVCVSGIGDEPRQRKLTQFVQLRRMRILGVVGTIDNMTVGNEAADTS